MRTTTSKIHHLSKKQMKIINEFAASFPVEESKTGAIIINRVRDKKDPNKFNYTTRKAIADHSQNLKRAFLKYGKQGIIDYVKKYDTDGAPEEVEILMARLQGKPIPALEEALEPLDASYLDTNNNLPQANP